MQVSTPSFKLLFNFPGEAIYRENPTNPAMASNSSKIFWRALGNIFGGVCRLVKEVYNGGVGIVRGGQNWPESGKMVVMAPEIPATDQSGFSVGFVELEK